MVNIIWSKNLHDNKNVIVFQRIKPFSKRKYIILYYPKTWDSYWQYDIKKIQVLHTLKLKTPRYVPIIGFEGIAKRKLRSLLSTWEKLASLEDSQRGELWKNLFPLISNSCEGIMIISFWLKVHRVLIYKSILDIIIGLSRRQDFFDI